MISLSAPSKLQHLVIPLAFMTISALLQWSGISDTLRYDRSHILQGELWRLFSAHFVHLSWQHWGLNSLGAWMLCSLFAQDISVKQWIGILIVGSVTVSFGLLCFTPEIAWYVGFSGVLHCGLVAAALLLLRKDTLAALVILTIVSIKLIAEQTVSNTSALASFIGGHIVHQAHLFGAAGGLVAALLFYLKANRPYARNKP